MWRKQNRLPNAQNTMLGCGRDNARDRREYRGPTWAGFLSALLTCLLGGGMPAALCGAPPNVVLIVVDDWGCADAGVLGSDFYRTPQIDAFARASCRFTQAYAAAPVCSPTRAAIMTGKSPARLDMTIWHEGAIAGGPSDRALREAPAVANLPRDELTLAEIFQRHGYETAHVGKWHLGKAAYYPETQGFDVNFGGTYWGAPASFFYPYRGVWSTSDPELRYVPVGPGKPGDYLTDRLTDLSIDWIRTRDQPFFLNLWFHSVHTPIQAKPGVVETVRRWPAGRHHQHVDYAGMIASLDENVGRILACLDEQGLRENTIVILTSDNGGVDFPTGKSGDRPPTKNIPYRAGKGTLYEGGLRVPLMVHWPGKTRPSTCSQMVISQDLLPTLATLFPHETLASDLDGVSLAPLLSAPNHRLDRQPLCWHYPHYYPRMTPASAIRDQGWKLIHYYEGDQVELYDLDHDPAEAHDLAEQQPQVATRLRNQLDQWRRDVDAKAPTAK